MIFESEIIAVQNEIGLTSSLNEVVLLPNSHFPRLIFQDFMNQLKINKISLGFKLNSVQLIEELPIKFEEIDDSIRFDKIFTEAINNENLMPYWLLTKLLKTSFNVNDIYVNYQSKQILNFRSKLPFTHNHNKDNEKEILNMFSFLTLKQKKESIERFFILLGSQYHNKLLLFLTYLETKYNFKLNKTEFIETSVGNESFAMLNNYTNQLFFKND